jgi:hypothetical protein
MTNKMIIPFFATKKGAKLMTPLIVGLYYFFSATLARGFFAFHFFARALYSLI